MTDYQLNTTLAGIEAAETKEELQAMIDAFEKKKEELEKFWAEHKKKEQISIMTEEGMSCQTQLERTAEELFDEFDYGHNSVYIGISVKKIIEFLVDHGYYDDEPSEPIDVQMLFLLEDLSYEDMRLDGEGDLIIPYE